MSIKALPAEAVRFICSSSHIANPVNLVKELVDNAIDAKATSIQVLIAPNTVDKIEVRDDGHGILRADFDALGCPGHTSKITCFDDLATRTAEDATLGFRGQGLAAAAILGHVAITTRTPADPVAASFRLAHESASGSSDGGIVRSTLKSASAPIGTTVTVTCLFTSLPVRRRTALQEASKALTAVKALLVGYALARPQVKLSMKVYQKPELSWNYSYYPMSQTGPSEAATRGAEMYETARVLFGNEVSRQCQDVVVSAAELLSLAGSGSQLVLEALLPRPTADLSKMALGAFISVDGRPLSAHHRGGFVRKLLAGFHGYLCRSVTHGPNQRHIRDAFMRLNIKCPAGSYDANIEPSKTDVLFANEKSVCDAFEQLCVRLYGEHHVQVPDARPVRTARDVLAGGYGLRHLTSTGMSLRSTVTPLVSPTPVSGPSSPAGPVARRLPRLAGNRLRVQKNGQLAVPIDVLQRSTSIQQRGHNRQTGNAHGLQTPPPSSPLQSLIQRRQGGRVGGRRAESLVHVDLPGLVSNDAYRQTTISFGRPSETTHPRQSASGHSGARELPLPAAGCIATRPQATTRMATHEAVPECARSCLATTLPTAGGGNSQQAGRQLARKVVHILEISMAELEEKFVRFVADGDWTGDFACLSPDTTDIVAVKRRLRQAVAGWLARTRTSTGLGTSGRSNSLAEIEFYLRRGLKGKMRDTTRRTKPE